MSGPTNYAWNSKYRYLEVSDAQTLKGLEANRRLKHAGMREDVALACPQSQMGERRATSCCGVILREH